MPAETKTCQNCKADFVIEPEDFDFYKKISVPPPTWCPDCRLQRRLSWRNDWHLFKKKEARTGEELFSVFPEESPMKIYDKDYWLSDAWDPMEYGRDYDFSRPFFEQFRELLYDVPSPAHSMTNIVNSSYCANANNIKNCYLVRAATYTEDSAYLIWDHASKQCYDSHMTDHCELGYGNVNTERCFKTFFSVDCEDGQELILCKDCNACSNCFGCAGLRNKQYCIGNEQYSKDEYRKRLEELNLGSHAAFEELKRRAYEHWLRYPRKFMHGRQNSRVSGDYIYESKNAFACYRVRNMEDVKYCHNILSGPVKDSYDYTNWGDNAERLYECLICGIGVSNLKFSLQNYPNVKNAAYSIFCKNASDLFGCVAVRNKQCCILNKQYSKEEYGALVPKIIEHMSTMPFTDSAGHIYRYGEFFPPEFSPFPYQVSHAYEFFPLGEDEARAHGFAWYPVKKQAYTVTLSAGEMPDRISDASDDIIDAVIGCVHEGRCSHECTVAFRIVKQELEFCRRMGLPLPRLCVNCRHGERLALRNEPRFYKRACMCQMSDIGGRTSDARYQNTAKHFHGDEPCPNDFETSYAPDRPEIVYCEQCYNSEVV